MFGKGAIGGEGLDRLFDAMGTSSGLDRFTEGGDLLCVI